MENIFEGVEFGTMFLLADGKTRAVYHHKVESDGVHLLMLETGPFLRSYKEDGQIVHDKKGYNISKRIR